MNKTLIFLCLSSSILVLSFIVICISPIINNFRIISQNWSFSSWRSLNCKIISDVLEDPDTIKLDEIQKMKKIKNLCHRKKGMYGLEFSSIVIDIILGFFCTNLSILHYFNEGKNFERKTGIIGLIAGSIGFILTFISMCFSGYIFTNDVAYGEINYDYFNNPTSTLFSGGITKLYPNGALRKNDGSNNFFPIYENDKSDFSEYVKYKDLGQKQYNYNKKLYELYHLQGQNCKTLSSSCDYYYGYDPFSSNENKDLHDRWLTDIILSFLIAICNIGLAFFGFLLFKNGGEINSEDRTIPIEEKKP